MTPPPPPGVPALVPILVGGALCQAEPSDGWKGDPTTPQNGRCGPLTWRSEAASPLRRSRRTRLLKQGVAPLLVWPGTCTLAVNDVVYVLSKRYVPNNEPQYLYDVNPQSTTLGRLWE